MSYEDQRLKAPFVFIKEALKVRNCQAVSLVLSKMHRISIAYL